MKVKRESEVTQLCPTLRDPMDCSPPGSSVHGIFQAKVLEWGAIAFSDIYTHTHTHTLYIYIYIYTPTHTQIYIEECIFQGNSSGVCVCVCVYVFFPEKLDIHILSLKAGKFSVKII